MTYFPQWMYQVCAAIRVKYDSLGGPTSFLLLPTSNELVNPDGFGRRNTFQNGPIYWSAASGAHPVVNHFFAAWQRNNWEAGPLGYPTTDEIVNPDGLGGRQEFQNTAAIYWKLNEAYAVRGAIRDKWNTVNAERPGSLLGYPISEEIVLPDGQGRMNRFERGVLYWHPHSVRIQLLAPSWINGQQQATSRAVSAIPLPTRLTSPASLSNNSSRTASSTAPSLPPKSTPTTNSSPPELTSARCPRHRVLDHGCVGHLGHQFRSKPQPRRKHSAIPGHGAPERDSAAAGPSIMTSKRATRSTTRRCHRASTADRHLERPRSARCRRPATGVEAEMRRIATVDLFYGRGPEHLGTGTALIVWQLAGPYTDILEARITSPDAPIGRVTFRGALYNGAAGVVGSQIHRTQPQFENGPFMTNRPINLTNKSALMLSDFKNDDHNYALQVSVEFSEYPTGYFYFYARSPVSHYDDSVPDNVYRFISADNLPADREDAGWNW